MTELLTFDKKATWFYNALVRTAWMEKYRPTSVLWHKVWHRCNKMFHGTIRTKVHGYSVALNFGNTYPIVARRFHSWNKPIVELAYQCHQAKKAPISVVDIGAATGDTVLLLSRNCPQMISNFYCVDGDPEFFKYLEHNINGIAGTKLFQALLSSSAGTEKALVRTHTATASAQGDDMVQSVTLDTLFADTNMDALDLLKIDVDGFDGKVLLGAQALLDKYQPAVIFEWHPILCQETGNDWTSHFEALTKAGYQTFIWFTKYGDFSHFMQGYDQESVAMIAEFCLQSRTTPDWHYDVIALHDDYPVSPIDVAELGFAAARRSPY